LHPSDSTLQFVTELQIFSLAFENHPNPAPEALHSNIDDALKSVHKPQAILVLSSKPHRSNAPSGCSAPKWYSSFKYTVALRTSKTQLISLVLHINHLFQKYP
jgi:hypothetical protein